MFSFCVFILCFHFVFSFYVFVLCFFGFGFRFKNTLKSWQANTEKISHVLIEDYSPSFFKTHAQATGVKTKETV